MTSTCKRCGAKLPNLAMFCGECGLNLSDSPSSSNGETQLSQDASPDKPQDAGTRTDLSAIVCEQCGTALDEEDIFCPECGRVSPLIHSSFRAPQDTRIIEPVTQVPSVESELDFESTELEAASVMPDFRQESESAIQADPNPFPEDLGSQSSPAAEPIQDSTQLLSARQVETSAVESEPSIDGAQKQSTKFVLQFSTGESFTVHGTGLVGRNPRPEPGEYFDHFVQIVDPGRSVSKTHLEFGQEGGEFWVKDRFSGNGTIIRTPERSPVRCKPDHRHSVARGSRVEIGEQFFIVI